MIAVRDSHTNTLTKHTTDPGRLQTTYATIRLAARHARAIIALSRANFPPLNSGDPLTALAEHVFHTQCIKAVYSSRSLPVYFEFRG
jgi:hypothetical protein